MPKTDSFIDSHLSKDSIDQIKASEVKAFFSRLLSARQDVDRLFSGRFGLSAYPYFEVLLTVRVADHKLSAFEIAENINISQALTIRYIEVLITKGLIERAGANSTFRLSGIGDGVLNDILRNHLTNAFQLVD